MFPLLYLVSIDQNIASFDPCVELWEFFVVGVCADTGVDPVAPVVDFADQIASVGPSESMTPRWRQRP